MAGEPVVVDASLVIKAILPGPETARCRAVLEQLGEAELVAPALWTYEVTSTLTKAIAFGALSHDEGISALNRALTLGVQLLPPDQTQCQLALEHARGLGRAAAYDSFYLVVAEALGAPFWTADNRLVRSFQGKQPGWLHSIEEINLED